MIAISEVRWVLARRVGALDCDFERGEIRRLGIQQGRTRRDLACWRFRKLLRPADRARLVSFACGNVDRTKDGGQRTDRRDESSVCLRVIRDLGCRRCERSRHPSDDARPGDVDEDSLVIGEGRAERVDGCHLAAHFVVGGST
jgi:hypothetical protein